MPTNGERLRGVQLAGHRALDKTYQPLAQQVDDAVTRRAQDGRLTPLAAPLILADVFGLIASVEPALVATILATARDAERAADPIGPLDETTLALAGSTALVSLRNNRSQVVRQVEGLLQRGLALDLTANQIAKTVRDYFSPFFAPRRSETGGLLRADRHGAIRSWPGRAGMASQHVRGVMLAETTGANFRGMRRRAVREREFLHYHVSHKHLEIDECDLLERQDIGFGTGIYPADDAPSVPRHFRCRCWYEPADRPFFLTKSESVPA